MKEASATLIFLASGLQAEAERIAAAEGTTLGQFINSAVAAKVSAMRGADYFRERAARADPAEFDAILDSFGDDDPPREGDEVDEPPSPVPPR